MECRCSLRTNSNLFRTPVQAELAINHFVKKKQERVRSSLSSFIRGAINHVNDALRQWNDSHSSLPDFVVGLEVESKQVG